jgi:hypothetical protein
VVLHVRSGDRDLVRELRQPGFRHVNGAAQGPFTRALLYIVMIAAGPVDKYFSRVFRGFSHASSYATLRFPWWHEVTDSDRCQDRDLTQVRRAVMSPPATASVARAPLPALPGTSRRLTVINAGPDFALFAPGTPRIALAYGAQYLH